MSRAEVLALLSQHKPEMLRRFGMRSLALFGSRAREQANVRRSMSDAGTPREWRFYVEDMIAFCDQALAYT
jgi:uncharacterized protein YjeT (DUF2065 family)